MNNFNSYTKFRFSKSFYEVLGRIILKTICRWIPFEQSKNSKGSKYRLKTIFHVQVYILLFVLVVSLYPSYFYLKQYLSAMEMEATLTTIKLINHDLLHLDRFGVSNFTWWQNKLKFLLTTLKIFYVLNPNLVQIFETSKWRFWRSTSLAKEKIRRWIDFLSRSYSKSSIRLILQFLYQHHFGQRNLESI